LERLIHLADTLHGIKINVPFNLMTKKQVYACGVDLSVPYENTWTCYKGGAEPCHVCDACKEREKGFEDLFMTDPLLEKK
jgi:7-cyano-7-deazaguanine synthase